MRNGSAAASREDPCARVLGRGASVSCNNADELCRAGCPCNLRCAGCRRRAPRPRALPVRRAVHQRRRGGCTRWFNISGLLCRFHPLRHATHAIRARSRLPRRVQRVTIANPTWQVIAPATAEVICTAAEAKAGDVDAAVAAAKARRTFGTFRARLRVLLRCACETLPPMCPLARCNFPVCASHVACRHVVGTLHRYRR